MPDFPPLPRSPELLSRDDSALLVVDVQTKLLNLIPNHQLITWNIRRLLDAAKAFDIIATATEQYPQGLGPTVPELAQSLGTIADKVRFSCGGCDAFVKTLRETNVSRWLVVGIESHVCVQQTVFDLLSAGVAVHVAVDAVAARHPIDHDTALRRIESAGATLTTTESVLFEWCEASTDPQFKTISKLIQQSPPDPA